MLCLSSWASTTQGVQNNLQLSYFLTLFIIVIIIIGIVIVIVIFIIITSNRPNSNISGI